MGTDRKGPLAAFVVIAIVAAILLVTSVRSQAEPPWLDQDELPATVVAAPPISDPLQWAPVVTLGQVVVHGVVLERKPAADPTDVPYSSSVVVSVADPTYDGSVPATATSGTWATHTATVAHHHPAHHTGHHTADHTAHPRAHQTRHHADPSSTASTATQVDQAAASSQTSHPGRHLGSSHVSGVRADHGHGRHLGWRHHS